MIAGTRSRVLRVRTARPGAGSVSVCHFSGGPRPRRRGGGAAGEGVSPRLSRALRSLVRRLLVLVVGFVRLDLGTAIEPVAPISDGSHRRRRAPGEPRGHGLHNWNCRGPSPRSPSGTARWRARPRPPPRARATAPSSSSSPPPRPRRVSIQTPARSRPGTSAFLEVALFGPARFPPRRRTTPGWFSRLRKSRGPSHGSPSRASPPPLFARARRGPSTRGPSRAATPFAPSRPRPRPR